MMARLAPALKERLETLTGEDAACCVADYAEAIRDARAGDAFDAALARAKAMADESRLLALALLKRRGSMCACEVQAALRLSHATVSHHMTLLVDAGLVTSTRRGRWAHYELTAAGKEVTP
jgi:ArsR family transcriptional regulator